MKCLFFEFGRPCYHYNFTAKPEKQHSADAYAKLFFSEINCPLHSEDDVLLCCILGEKDAGNGLISSFINNFLNLPNILDLLLCCDTISCHSCTRLLLRLLQ